MEVTVSDIDRRCGKVSAHISISEIDPTSLLSLQATTHDDVDVPLLAFSSDGSKVLGASTSVRDLEVVLPALETPLILRIQASSSTGEAESHDVSIRPISALFGSIKSALTKSDRSRSLQRTLQSIPTDRISFSFDQMILLQEESGSFGIITGMVRIPRTLQADGDLTLQIYDCKMNAVGKDVRSFEVDPSQTPSDEASDLVHMAFSVVVPSKTKGIVLACADVSGRRLPGFGSLDAKSIRALKKKAAYLFSPAPNQPSYADWLRVHSASPDELAMQANMTLPMMPVFSIIVPLYKTPLPLFSEMVSSVLAQSYANWELVLVNASPEDAALCEAIEHAYASDGRIVRVQLDQNEGITLNTAAGIDAATGEFIGFLDHDDFLMPEALFECAAVIAAHPETDLIYSDEDHVSPKGEPIMPFFKTDYSVDRLRNNNYMTHFTVVRASLLRQIDYRDERFDGAQDYNMVLSACERTTHIHHIPKILYHWRIGEDSTAGNPDAKDYANEAGRLAIQESLDRQGIQANVEYGKRACAYHVRYTVTGDPLVSIIIPVTDPSFVLGRCLVSIVERTTYANYEIILVQDNMTKLDEASLPQVLIERGFLRVCQYDGQDRSFASLIDHGAKEARGDYLLFFDEKAEVITTDWIEELLGNAQRPEVGAVGCMLFYPNDTVQHAGIVFGVEGPSVVRRFMPRSLMESLSDQCNWSAVSGSCLMTKRSIFQEMNGFDVEFSTVLSDIDYCLRLGAAGYSIVYTPYVELYLYEPFTRTCDKVNTAEVRELLMRDEGLLKNRWAHIYATDDPYMGYHWNRARPYASYFRIEPFETMD